MVKTNVKQRPTIIIVGAGIAGLSAAINAEQNGIHAILVESQPMVGGLCTGWFRKGRYLDGCIHWLTGTNPNTDLYEMWKNVRAFKDDDDIINLDSFGTIEYEGTQVTFYTDVDKCEKEWLKIAPIDTKEIKKFFKMVRDFMSVQTPCSRPMNNLGFKTLMKTGFSILKVWPSYLLTMKKDTDKYSLRFKHPAIRNAIKLLQPGPGNLFSMLYSYSTITALNGGIPKGGSKLMSENMKDYFLELGGTLKLSRSVESIIIEDKKAVGVLLDNGDSLYADYVVTTVSPEIVIKDFLKCQYNLPSFVKRFKKNNPIPTCCLLQYEIEDFPNLDTQFTFQVEPLTVATKTITHIGMRNHAYDKDLYVKNNKTIVSIIIDHYDEDYFYWEELYNTDKVGYYKEKERILKEVQKRIETRFPELIGKITPLDLATPHTFKRYTNSTRGGFMSFVFTPKNSMYHADHIRGLKNLYLIGQWVSSPGGVPFALMTGQHIIQKICKKEKIKCLSLNPLKTKGI